MQHDVQHLSLNQIKPEIVRDSQPGKSILQHGLLFVCLSVCLSVCLFVCLLFVKGFSIVPFPLSNSVHIQV